MLQLQLMVRMTVTTTVLKIFFPWWKISVQLLCRQCQEPSSLQLLQAVPHQVPLSLMNILGICWTKGSVPGLIVRVLPQPHLHRGLCRWKKHLSQEEKAFVACRKFLPWFETSNVSYLENMTVLYTAKVKHRILNLKKLFNCNFR